ncbi:MAG: hypothetical protein IPO90_04460 [Flavobacteriales bacterium]|nr:hypothetical protein [Flavobacteriales bacterium]
MRCTTTLACLVMFVCNAVAQERPSAWKRAEKRFAVGLDLGLSLFEPGRAISTQPPIDNITSLQHLESWAGLMGEFAYDGLVLHLGWAYQTNSAVGQVSFAPYGTETFRATSSANAFRVWRGRIGYEVRFLGEHFSFEPYLAVALNTAANTGTRSGSSTTGLMITAGSPDTVRTRVERTYVQLTRQTWTGAFGGRLAYRAGRMLLSVNAEYLAGARDWYAVDITASRSSTVNGTTYDAVRFVARADRWTFGLGIGIDLLRPKVPEAGIW